MTLFPAAATAPIAAAAPPAPAAETTVNYQCRGSAVGQTVEFKLDQDADVDAPATVAPEQQFNIVITPKPNRVPDKIENYTVKEVRNIKLRVPVPANSTFVSADLSGGAGLNSTPSVSREGDDVIVSLPGPLQGGAEFTLPVTRVTLTSGQQGVIEGKLGGSSFDDPGLTLDAAVQVGPFTINAPVSCYPNPNPVRTRTVIR
ncbi:cyclase [Longimycelium tulufanense]|uniref:Cyclase n=1 Tax=Longimycelium tulufanense TaxID=907463 RepID=A0A8J3CH38_9PSEU|nr:cyclase [Longimycelium tulufanense]